MRVNFSYRDNTMFLTFAMMNKDGEYDPKAYFSAFEHSWAVRIDNVNRQSFLDNNRELIDQAIKGIKTNFEALSLNITDEQAQLAAEMSLKSVVLNKGLDADLVDLNSTVNGENTVFDIVYELVEPRVLTRELIMYILPAFDRIEAFSKPAENFIQLIQDNFEDLIKDKNIPNPNRINIQEPYEPDLGDDFEMEM